MKSNDQIKTALSENLSGLYVSRAQRMALLTEITGGRKMKRKLTVGLVFAIVLILFAVTALAAITLGSFQHRAQMSSSLGNFDQWSLEDKARLGTILLETGTINDDYPYHSLPSPQDITMEEALSIAKAEVRARYQLEDNALDGYIAVYDFFAFPDPVYPSYWRIGLTPSSSIGAGYRYEVNMVASSGSVEYVIREATLEEPDQPEEPVPYPNEITKEDAILFAKKAIRDSLASGETLGLHPLSQDEIDLMANDMDGRFYGRSSLIIGNTSKDKLEATK
jgi:hypothetical protein